LGALAEGDAAMSIRAVVVQMNDLTEQKQHEAEVEREVRSVTKMLERVIPTSVVKQLADGTDAISFAVQTASIGCILIDVGTHEPTVDDPFAGVHKLFALFDGWMEDFGQLSRIRVSASEYIFAAGVFILANKPAKHAEEATRFALKIIASAAEVVAAVGPHISILIGLNIGGPLIAGVMNSQRSIFQLIGTPVELATQLAETGVKIRGGKSVHTYVITP
jgi:hypothetical protein